MSEPLNLTLVFCEREPAKIQATADATSDPDHPDYGRHLDRAGLDALVRLPAEERALVTTWLQANEIEVLDTPEAAPQLMFARATRAQVERAFGDELIQWLGRNGDHRGMRIASAMPRRLAGYVLKIGGLPGEQGQMDNLIEPLPPTEGEAARPGPASPSGGLLHGSPVEGGRPPALDGFTPAHIADIYNFPAHLTGAGETIGLMMLGGEVRMSDLHAFWHGHGITPPEVHTVQIGPVHSRPSQPLHLLEAAMTIEWAGAMAPGARIVVYRLDPTIMGDPWSAFLMAVLADRRYAPTIACTSWISPERRYYRQHGHGVVRGLLNQAAALGLTVVSAAGDWGAFDGIPRTVRDGRYVSDAPWPHAVFPAVEDRVLAVGGSMITRRDRLTEVAWSGPPPPGLQKAVVFETLASSGGFSEDVAIPAWQKPALRGSYSRGAATPAVVPYGRGFPDVALAAAGPHVQRSPGGPLTSTGYQAVACGQWIDYAGGTSVAAPIWAAILARANQARRAAGLSRVGFVNPLLYRLREAQPDPFRPVTVGGADVAMTVLNLHGRAMTYHLPGYDCQPGWDPVTGLGVPNVEQLIAHLIAVPCPGHPPLTS